MSKLQDIRELAQEHATSVSSSPRDWMGYMDTAARLYRYPFTDQLLIHAQHPQATACASLELWNEKMFRWVNRGARGIALLDENGHNTRLRYVFDISDTHMVAGGRSPYLWQMQEHQQEEILTHLAEAYGLEEKDTGTLSDALMAVAREMVADSLEEYLDGLEYAAEGTYLEDLDVELIKAVMMQESGGRGLDPMQAAEGSFNTRYPHEPNGIQDPEYSIECGVQELKAALISAEVENPIDMEHIKLALQGYNFGNGYISWAKTNYGGYSYANAVEFSTMQAARLGWDSYGDTQYPAHVLRYYPYGRAFTSGGNQAIVEVALTQLGNEGGQPYWSWYGFDGRVEWCACFVSWCADQCSYIESGIIPKFAGCVDGANWFKGNGQWKDRSYEPSAGDIIFFDWEGDGETDHVGIVEKCENGVVYTVEGNSGDACRQKQYTVGSSSIYGYGVPAY